MTNEHPITPPPELLDQWCITGKSGNLHNALTLAYRAGADHELEACGRWLEDQLCMTPDARADVITQLNGARRPKPPSLRKQAYDALDTYIYGEPDPKDKERTYNTIRRALESLDD